MATLVIDSANSAMKIQAIKEFRSISGYGLKESKDVIDAAANGERQEIDGLQIGEDDIQRLGAAGVEARLRGSKTALHDLISILGRFPAEMTVEQLVHSLRAVRRGVLASDIDPGEAV